MPAELVPLLAIGQVARLMVDVTRIRDAITPIWLSGKFQPPSLQPGFSAE
jgi:hypothetical protein